MFVLTQEISIGLLNGLVNGSNHTKAYRWPIGNVGFNLLVLTYILLNTIKNFTTIPWQLN